MSRDWSKFENDEIQGIWYSYCKTEFPAFDDPLSHNRSFKKTVRLTPVEIIKLVEELLRRLDSKDNPENE